MFFISFFSFITTFEILLRLSFLNVFTFVSMSTGNHSLLNVMSLISTVLM